MREVNEVRQKCTDIIMEYLEQETKPKTLADKIKASGEIIVSVPLVVNVALRYLEVTNERTI